MHAHGGELEKLIRGLRSGGAQVRHRFEPSAQHADGAGTGPLSKDGRIHTDSRTKILTVLLYMSGPWSDAGGRLRLLRSENMDDYFAEVAPDRATAVFFRCSENAWHGHAPYVGERRAIQLNWVTDESVVRREQGRHRFSSKLKGLKNILPSFGASRA